MPKYFDPRRVLENSIIYNTFQHIVGGVKARRLFVENDVKLQANQKILDIGCGPGYLIDFLPEANYTGIDIDNNYIKTAKERYPNDTFFCTPVEAFKLETLHTFDVVIAAGVVHHLTNDQAYNLFSLAKKALKPNGRLITLDGCYTKKQNPIAKKLLDMDRGQFVRTEAEYIELANLHFSTVKTKIDNSYFNIPYTSIIMECS